MSDEELRGLRGHLIRWSLLMLASVAVFVVLGAPLQAAGLGGIAEMEFERTAAGMKAIAQSWNEHGLAYWGGFAMGFDYVFMIAYGAALYFGAKAARVGFAPGSGPFATAFRVMGWFAILAAVLDAIENAAETWIVFGGGPGSAAPIAYGVTMTKWACVAVSDIGWFAGLAALLTGRLKPRA